MQWSMTKKQYDQWRRNWLEYTKTNKHVRDMTFEEYIEMVLRSSTYTQRRNKIILNNIPKEEKISRRGKSREIDNMIQDACHRNFRVADIAKSKSSKT